MRPLWSIDYLQKVEHRQIATLVPYEYLRALFVLVTSNDRAVEEVIPLVSLLECLRHEEVNLLFADREEKVLPRLDD